MYLALNRWGGEFWGIHIGPPYHYHLPKAHGISHLLSQKGNTMVSTTNNTYDSLSKSPNRLVATIFGVVYLLIGFVGFLIASNVGFTATEGEHLFGIFEVNNLHNIVHVLIGAVLLAAGLKSVRHSKTANATVGGVYLLVGIVGLFILDSALNILALNSADNVLHFLSALVLLGVGLGVERNATPARTSTSNLT